MKTAVLLLLSGLTALADSVNVAWNLSPTPGVVSTRIYYSQTNPAPAKASAFVTIVSPTTTATITNVGIGKTYFQATALLQDGTESVGGNVVVHTNLNFAPLNLRITGVTNEQAAIWVENPGTKLATVEHSADMATWMPYASLKVFDADAGSRAIFLGSIRPQDAQFWRVRLDEPYVPQSAPLPSGLILKAK